MSLADRFLKMESRYCSMYLTLTLNNAVLDSVVLEIKTCCPGQLHELAMWEWLPHLRLPGCRVSRSATLVKVRNLNSMYLSLDTKSNEIQGTVQDRRITTLGHSFRGEPF